MSEHADLFICSESEGEHRLGDRKPLALLRSNSYAGCKTCNLLVDALKSFHGEWILAQANVLEVTRLQSWNRTLSVWLHLGNCASVPEDYEFEAASDFPAVLVEIVYKPVNAAQVSFSSLRV